MTSLAAARAVLLSLCAACVACAAAGDGRADEWRARARAQARESRLGPALAAADSALALDPEDRETRVLRARILSWQGKQAEAEVALRAVLEEHPGDVEARLALASLRYYQGRLPEAEEAYRGVLADDVANAEAREGLERVRAARAAAAARPWRADAGFGYSAFTRREQADWRQQYVQISRVSGDGRTSAYGRVEDYQQFRRTDVSVEMGVGRVFHPRFNASVSAGVTPSSDFRPAWSLATDAEYLVLRLPRSGLPPSVRLLAGYRFDAYEAVKVSGFQPGVRLEWGEPLALTVKASRVREEGASPLYGVSARLDAPLGPSRVGALSGMRFWIGAADAPETVRAATISTRTVFAGLGTEVGRDWLFSMGYARDDREDSWIRHAVDVDVARRF